MKRIPLQPPAPPQPAPRRPRYAILVVSIALVALAGYLGYVTYPRFGLPAVTGAGLFVLAAAAGLASFFSPCSFPLLLTLLARGVRGQERGGHAQPALRFAAAFSLGAVAFLLLLGAFVGLGGSGVAASVTFPSVTGIAVRVTVGLLLVFLGLVQAGLLPVSFHAVEPLFRPALQRQARFRARHPVAGFALFGFSYLIIGFG